MSKQIYCKITKQDDEGCFFSWVEMFECRNIFITAINTIKEKYGHENIGVDEISFGAYLIIANKGN